MQDSAGVRKPSAYWNSLIADLILMGMLTGPIIAPFFAASSSPILSAIAQIIYWMGHHVCPQPHMGIELKSPFIMAVCMRCYGTITGLSMARLLYTFTGGKGFYWLAQYHWNGVAITTLLMMNYPIELAAQTLHLWKFNTYIVTPFGLITGLAWGLFTMPILHSNHPT